MAVAFLSTIVWAPDRDDWDKMVHMRRCIRGTHKLPLILSANRSVILKWWVDASFSVHPNMRGHSGGGFYLGRGFPIVSSTKQKLNTCSSTKTKLVGDDDFMPEICWTRFFEGSRIHNLGQRFVSGQQDFYSFGEEWKSFELQAH